MSPAAEEIWAILHEVAQSQKTTDSNLEESRREFDQRLKENDQEFKKQMQEVNAIIASLGRQIKEVNASIGRLGDKLGDFVEEMVRPAAVRLFREQGIDVHEVHRNVTSQRNNEGIEIDLLVVNDTDVVAIECKSTLSIDDVNEHLERLAKVKKLLPTYASKRVLGAVTGMVIPDNVARYAYNKGLYVIAQSGDHLLIRNDAKFIPQAW